MIIHYEVVFYQKGEYFDMYGMAGSVEDARNIVKDLKTRYPEDDIRIIKVTEEEIV